MNANQTAQHRPTGWAAPIGVGIGGGLGLVVGAVVEQVSLGLIMGAGLGLVVGTTLTSIAGVPRRQRRSIVAIATALVVAGSVLAFVVLAR